MGYDSVAHLKLSSGHKTGELHSLTFYQFMNKNKCKAMIKMGFEHL